MAVEFRRAVPILRILDVEKAREFYLGFLGLAVDWEHRFEENSPLFLQVSRGDMVLHLSEHHGDGTPGAVVDVEVRGLEEFHREVNSRGYKYMRPGIDEHEWKTMQVNDPFGNRIRFHEFKTT